MLKNTKMFTNPSADDAMNAFICTKCWPRKRSARERQAWKQRVLEVFLHSLRSGTELAICSMLVFLLVEHEAMFKHGNGERGLARVD